MSKESLKIIKLGLTRYTSMFELNCLLNKKLNVCPDCFNFIKECSCEHKTEQLPYNEDKCFVCDKYVCICKRN